RGPRVGRAGERVARPHPQVVVGAEEAGEAEPLGVLGEGELVAVRGALLGFDEDAKVHAPSLPGPGRGTPAGSWPGPGCRGGRATAPAGAGDCRDLAAVVAVGPTGPSVGRLAGSHLTCPSRTHFSDHLLPRVPQTRGGRPSGCHGIFLRAEDLVRGGLGGGQCRAHLELAPEQRGEDGPDGLEHRTGLRSARRGDGVRLERGGDVHTAVGPRLPAELLRAGGRRYPDAVAG